ncbi:hypothetical protein POM88_001680 [Heracleum sosnowskyi]|uniref:Uncharacterized protein n=1 Tax=Heracleum sosnowskyi TaxID=360622 RepID=A0AAD8N590_9APIA|nr:hypothetical protein POM88_001680 [Heracleum sosnowskyi]
MNMDVRLSHLTPYASRDLWAETLRKYAVASGKKDATKQTFIDMFEKCRVKGNHEGNVEGKHEDYVIMKLPEYLGEDKTVLRHEFAVGSIVRKAKGKLENEFLHVPATLEDNHTVDHDILDFVDCIGRGIFKEKKCVDKLWAYTLSQAENEQPSLSGLITFNRIVPASSDPLNGIYIGSNGCLVTEVIQISRKFGHWPGHDGDDLSKLEPCNYVEVVKLTGDPDVPAGQFLRTYTWTWIEAEVFILGEEYRKEGFAIGFLFPAPDYYFMKLFKQLRLESFGGSH